MAAQVGKFAANAFLKKELKKNKDKKVDSGDVSRSISVPNESDRLLTFAGQDPYYALVEDPRRPGKYKKVKKTIPAYIPEHDAMVLAKVRRRAYRLDMGLFNFLGIRFGWDAVIGLIPMIGDAIGVLMALNVLRTCMQIEGGLTQSIKTRMMINVIMDFVVGLIPFLGDLADAAFKCNTKNLRLLEETLDKKYKPSARDERHLAGVDREQRRKNRASGIFRRDDPPPATAFEEFSDDEWRDDDRDRRQQPPPAYSGGRRGDDVEMAETRQERGTVRR